MGVIKFPDGERLFIMIFMIHKLMLRYLIIILTGFVFLNLSAEDDVKVKKEKESSVEKKKEIDEKKTKSGTGKIILLQNGINGYQGCTDGCFFVDHPPAKRRDRLELETKKNFKAGFSVKFDITSAKLPAPDQIESATMILYAMRQSRSKGKGRIQYRTGDWTQSEGHKKIKSLIGEEITIFTFKDYRKGKGPKIIPPVPVRINITAAVRKWIKNPKTNHGIVMTPASSVDVFFHSTQARKPEFRPTLEIQLKNKP